MLSFHYIRSGYVHHVLRCSKKNCRAFKNEDFLHLNYEVEFIGLFLVMYLVEFDGTSYGSSSR